MANEKRLIDANKLRKVIIEYLNDTHGIDEFSFDNCFPYWIFAKAIEFAPTVDAVEVVRCKDCKHWNEIDSIFCTANKECRCSYLKGLFDYCKPNDFCSYGERREGE